MVDLHYYAGFSLVAAGWGRAVVMLHCSAQVSHSRGFSLQRWTPVFAIHGLNSLWTAELLRPVPAAGPGPLSPGLDPRPLHPPGQPPPLWLWPVGWAAPGNFNNCFKIF